MTPREVNNLPLGRAKKQCVYGNDRYAVLESCQSGGSLLVLDHAGNVQWIVSLI